MENHRDERYQDPSSRDTVFAREKFNTLLTLPSSRRPTGCARWPPLMSNV